MCKPWKDPYDYTPEENTRALIGEGIDEMNRAQLNTMYRCMKCVIHDDDTWDTLHGMLDRINEMIPFE